MKTKHYFLLFTFCILFSCKQAYDPPVVKTDLSLLVVDGFLNNGTDTSFIRLSRTKKIAEGTANAAENGAQMIIEDEASNPLYFFQQQNNNGVYILPGMSLDINRKYRLRINTATGKQYLSDELPVSNTPPIDSVSWKRTNEGVNIYATTHDPANKTKYYRWDYTETYQHHPPYFSTMKYQGGILSYRSTSELIYDCWTTENSTELLLASSAKLSSDIIFEKKLRSIATNSIELSVKYSILARQYALTEEAFLYLENLKKISEQMGSIFDAQPSQLTGNIHSVTDISEPVLGYLLATTSHSQRIYIKNSEVQPWLANPYCQMIEVTPDSLGFYFGDMGYLPIDFNMSTSITTGAQPICVDCRVRGGTLIKPDFWQ